MKPGGNGREEGEGMKRGEEGKEKRREWYDSGRDKGGRRGKRRVGGGGGEGISTILYTTCRNH